MSRQFSLFQLFCVFLIASSAHGGQLPTSITSQYSDCFEITHFSSETPVPSLRDSFPVDNLCIEWNGLSYHFLSSAEGGTTSFIVAPKAGLTVCFLEAHTIGMKLDWHSRFVVSFLCRFRNSAHVLQIYNDVYKFVPLKRHDFTLYRVQKVLLDQIGAVVVHHSEVIGPAGLYSEFYKDMQIIFTVKEEYANDDVGVPVLIFMAKKYNISDVLVNSNVVLRFDGDYVLYIILTFADQSQAKNFCDSFHYYFKENLTVQVPPLVNIFLRTKRV